MRDARPANAEALNSDTHILCKTRAALKRRKLVRYKFAVIVLVGLMCVSFWVCELLGL